MTPPTWGDPAPGEPDGWGVQTAAAYGERPAAHDRRPAPYGVQGSTGPRYAVEGATEVMADGRRVKVRVVERFPGQRVHHRTGPLRRIRSAVALLVTALVVGAVLAAGLAAVVWGISVAIHHATTS